MDTALTCEADGGQRDRPRSGSAGSVGEKRQVVVTSVLFASALLYLYNRECVEMFNMASLLADCNRVPIQH